MTTLKFCNKEEGQTIVFEPLSFNRLDITITEMIDKNDSGMAITSKEFILDWEKSQKLFQLLKNLGHK